MPDKMGDLRREIAETRKRGRTLLAAYRVACWEAVEDVKCSCGGYEDGLHGRSCRLRQSFEALYYRELE